MIQFYLKDLEIFFLWDEVWTDPTQAYFIYAVNKVPNQVFFDPTQRYFLTQCDKRLKKKLFWGKFSWPVEGWPDSTHVKIFGPKSSLFFMQIVLKHAAPFQTIYSYNSLTFGSFFLEVIATFLPLQTAMRTN